MPTITQTVTMTFEDDYNNAETAANIRGLLREMLEDYQARQATLPGPPVQEKLTAFEIT